MIENINIKIPAEFMSDMWNAHGNRIVPSINISYEFDGVRTEVFMITATTTRHRNIKWSDKLYAYINKEAHTHAIANYKIARSNVRQVDDKEMKETFGMTAVELAELHTKQQANATSN